MASQIYSRYVPPSKKSTNKLPIPPTPATLVFESSKSIPPATRHDASSTYVRYIPPSKKKQPVIAQAVLPVAEVQSSTPSPKRKHAALEYVDTDFGPKKTKKHKKTKPTEDSDSRYRREGIEKPLDVTGIHRETSNSNAASRIETGMDLERKEELQDRSQLTGSGPSVRDQVQGKQTIKRHKKDKKLVSDSKDSSPQDAGTGLTGGANKRKSKKKAPVNNSLGSGDETDVSDDVDTSRHKKLLQKREKSLKKAEKLSKTVDEVAVEPPSQSSLPLHAEEVHDLVPLSQPAPIPEPPAPSITASLPSWLTSPIRVAPTTTASFQDLGLSQETENILHEKGFSDAFAVQAAVLPLLLPGKLQQPGDVLVSAATGSGKTLAYVLPMIEDISRRNNGSIQGLIVMPTRELVAQARQVCEICVSAFAKGDGYGKRASIGTAVGNETMQAEQDALIGEELQFDLAEYDHEMKVANTPWESSSVGADENGLVYPESKSRLPGHVRRLVSKVDVLICTPGRLVEHLKSTPGFSLQDVRWLVVDEADKLLNQSFQQWLEIVMDSLHSSRKHIRDRVRRVILSATMTSDIGQLASLKLYRPKLVVLEGTSHDEADSTHQLTLPALLQESAIKVEDDVIKPLYLMEILKREKLLIGGPSHYVGNHVASDMYTSESDVETDASTTDSDSDSSAASSIPRVESLKQTSSAASGSALIFTKSNETAVRLGRLISLLYPAESYLIGTLTSTTPRQSRQRTISSFLSGKKTILVASDLVSRGLDLPNLAHVINYDIPTSLTSYVHRIGRTARAGKEGHAWTLLTASEAGWFWSEIARGDKIQRSTEAKVERVNIKKDLFDAEREWYEDALKALEKEAMSKNGGN